MRYRGVIDLRISDAARELDEEISVWRNRPLGRYQYLMLDARHEHVRQANAVVSSAVLIAVGIMYEGQRELPGVSVSLSEAEMHWRQFLQSLMERGMHGLAMVIPDAHSGLRKALETCFPGTPWQRVPVPPAAERNEPCAQGIHAHRGGGRNTVDSDCAGQAGG